VDYSNAADAAKTLKSIAPKGFAVVFDAVGGSEQALGWEVITSGGRFVSIVDTPSSVEAQRKFAKSGFVFVAPNGKELAQIADLLNKGKIKAPAVREVSVTRRRNAPRKRGTEGAGQSRPQD